MHYRKFKAENIFTGTDLLDNKHILITNENGIVENIIKEQDAGDNIEIFEGIISPGFINCHCHLELSHMKNVVERKTGLVNFLLKVISKRSEAKENIQQEIIAADNEMYNNGIVAVADVCNTTDSLQTKQQSKIQYQNFIEVIGFTEERANILIESSLKIYKTFCDGGFEQNTSVIPHAPYTISAAMFKLINDLSQNKIISIHNQETLAEDELYQTKTGDFLKLYKQLNINTDFFQPYNTTSLQAYLPLLNKPQTVLLIHNTFTKQNDIDFAFHQTNQTEQKLFWCLCPNANLFIENILPPVEMFVNNHCNIVLGTDSYSSNYSLNILNEMKTIQQNYPSVSLHQLLQWATINGAAALNLHHTFGSFEKGKQPGINLISNISNGKLTAQSTIKKLI